jgi:hypothetical protein
MPTLLSDLVLFSVSPITLRQGARVIEDSRRLRVVSSQ